MRDNLELIYLFSSLIILFLFYPSIENRQSYEAFLGLCFLTIILSYEIFKKINWSVGLIFGFLILSGLKIYFFPATRSYQENAHEIAYAMMLILFFASALLSINKDFFGKILAIICLSAFLNSVVILFNFFNNGSNYGMLNNKAADASFIACMLPMALSRWPYAIIMALAILVTRSSTGIAAAGVALASTLFLTMKLKDWMLLVIALGIFISLFAYGFLGSELFDTSGRSVVFAESLNYFKNHANYITGFGTGTFSFLAKTFQKAHSNQIWIWLHNEYLEVLFENGIIGLILTLLALANVLISLWRQKTIYFAICVVYAFTALTQMPLRLFVTQLLGICLLAKAFKTEHP